MAQSSYDFLASRVATIEQEKAARADRDRLNQGVPFVVDCIKKLGHVGLSEEEIADLFRHAADELEKTGSEKRAETSGDFPQ